MVGLQPLELRILVRIQVPEPKQNIRSYGCFVLHAEGLGFEDGKVNVL